MALNIKDPETDRLARELAQETGESITEAARVALAERLSRVRAGRRDRYASEEARRIVARTRQLKINDARTDDEIIGYDADGLPG